MPITPITLQMTIPMTNDMAQVQNQENMRSTTEHIQFADATDRQMKTNNETVIPKDNAQFAEYKYDAREKGHNEYVDMRQKKKKSKKDSSDTGDNAQDSEKDQREKKKQIVSIDVKL